MHYSLLQMVSEPLCIDLPISIVTFFLPSCIEYLYELRQACVEYFKLGGSAVSGPVGLLSV